MLGRRVVVWILSGVMTVSSASVVTAQAYPNKPIRIVAPEPGGSVDFTVRLIAQWLTENLGQQVVVDNRGGPSGQIAAQAVVKASPDGYTLLVYGPSLWLLPFFRNDVPYDFAKDFAPITLLAKTPNVLVVHPSVAAQTVKELIVLAKARPGELNYGSGSPGSSSHLAMELFKTMAGVNIVRVPHKGVGQAVIGLLGGHVQVMCPPVTTVMSHVKAGKLRALGITSAQPSALAPGLVTMATTVPGYESVAIYAMFAPAKTPALVIQRLNQEIVRFLHMTDVREQLLSAGVEAVGSSPEQLAAALKSDIAITGKLIKDAGIVSN